MHSHCAGDNQQTTMGATHHLKEWGDSVTVTTKIAKRRLEWLVHITHMPDQSMLEVGPRLVGSPRPAHEEDHI